MHAMLRRYLSRLSTQSGYAVLPPRILQRVREQQDSSEVLIGWIQLGVALTFATLYAVSPKTFNPEETFAPVPWALGIYLAFTAIRLGLALRMRLPAWLLYLSAVLDIALLLGLIWTFHLQYGQPPAFYLRVPTLLYVFIFIALRALQFQVRYVVITGLTAAMGWLWMVSYAVDPNRGGIITRDYLLYMSIPDTVLLGAEFDKVISILAMTVILAVAIARNRRLLLRAVIDASAARDLSRFVPSLVAHQVTSAAEEVQVGQGETREATILFTDIEGFTSISERLSPTELIQTLNEYFAVVAEPIERHGGVINTFIGDAILATFNLPAAHPDHAANAVRATLEIQRLLRDRTFGDGIALHSRIGINTGVVVGGLVGTAERLAYTVYGDEVNLAARLEPLNKEYGTRILVSESTRERAGRDRFAFQRIGEVMVRGRQRPTVVYTLPTP